MLTINGTGFQQGVNVFITGSSGYVGANFVSATQLTVTNVSISTPGTYSVYVVDPPPAGTSAPATLTVTGPPDFSFTVAAGQGSQTVNAGQTATFTNVITITAMNGFARQVAASCTVPAQNTTCAVNPNTINAGQSANVVVTTQVRTALGPPSLWNRRMISWPRLLPMLVLTVLLCFLLTRWERTRRQRLAAAVPLAGLVLFLLLQAVGCGGGSSQPPPPPPPTGTQAGTYTITVTGTSAATNTTHTVTLQLVVN
jgi:hypothetical protein